MGCSKSSSKREVYSNKFYHKKQEKSQINNLTLPLKQLENEEQKNPKVSRRKEKKGDNVVEGSRQKLEAGAAE